MEPTAASGPKRRVCLFDFSAIDDFHGYEIRSFDVSAYDVDRRYFPISDLVRGGLNQSSFRKRLYLAETIDKLYRQRDPEYTRLWQDFVSKFHDFDLIVLANYNPIHPEILYHELKRPIKILGLVDDPFSSYVRGIPYLWAVDGAFYISPSYDERSSFREKLEQWGCTQHVWYPLRPHHQQRPEPSDEFFHNRDIDVVYVGLAYGPKIDRLAKLKKRFGKRFRIHGRWPLGGCYGIMRGLWGKEILWARVAPLTTGEREHLYYRTKIGLNMHLSDVPRETGNMRMYEVPSHGLMLLCDKAGLNLHEQIFTPGKEAVFYDDLDDAIAKIEYYLGRDNERVQIAKAGFDRTWQDYEWETALKRLLDWAMSVRKRSRCEQVLR
jgi:hypothetical protein